MKRSGLITLLTDFGLADPYVAMMKGVILSVKAEARIVDITHEVEPGAIVRAQGIIEEAFSWFPGGTVHVAVVDPGVGTERRPIIAICRSHLFVGPDNGIFWPIISHDRNSRVVEITETRFLLPHVSRTFHGRDIFAPVAAHLAGGADPLEMGKVLTEPVKLTVARPYRRGNTLHGKIVRVDRFGNLITDIHRRDTGEFAGDRNLHVKVGDLVIEGLKGTYAEAGKGEILCLFGSSGYLEIAVNMGKACDRLGMGQEEAMGTEVKVTPGS